MCGRYTHRRTWRQIVEDYRITEPEIGPGEAEPETPGGQGVPTGRPVVLTMSRSLGARVEYCERPVKRL